MIDDRLPTDLPGDCLLTVTEAKEIWPALLAKAMLKVLTPDNEQHLFKDPVWCLMTLMGGWLPQLLSPTADTSLTLKILRQVLSPVPLGRATGGQLSPLRIPLGFPTGGPMVPRLQDGVVPCLGLRRGPCRPPDLHPHPGMAPPYPPTSLPPRVGNFLDAAFTVVFFFYLQ